MAAATLDHQTRDQPKDAENQKQSHELEALLASLPKRKGWNHRFLYQYKGVWLSPPRLASVLSLLQHFKPDPSVSLLVTSMKVGTTWLKALAFAIASRQHQYSLKDHPLLHDNPHDLVASLEYNGLSSHASANHIFHTHMPYSLTEESIKKSTCRVVYLCRNPGDTFVSAWKFFRKLRPSEMGELPLEEAFEMFCSGVSLFGPYWDHVLGYWKAQQERPDKVLFMKYEELQRDQVGQVKRLADFLGFPFSKEEEKEATVEKIMKLRSFDNLSNLEANKTGKFMGMCDNNLFFRKGRVGDSAEYLTEKMVKRLNAITEEKLGGCGLELNW